MALSIIIPVGPGDTTWKQLLPDLSGLDTAAEIVLVAVRGSLPERFDPAAWQLRSSVRWIEAAQGRAAQLNAGAASARGSLLCFLHSDSRLPNRSLDTLQHHPHDPNTVYYFDLHFLPDGPRMMVLNRLGALVRSRLFGMPFGDQGLTLSRALWSRLGGFDGAVGCGEDHDLVWRARRLGAAITPFRAPIHTSARKYLASGWLRTTLHHLYLTARQARRFSNRERVL